MICFVLSFSSCVTPNPNNPDLSSLCMSVSDCCKLQLVSFQDMLPVLVTVQPPSDLIAWRRTKSCFLIVNITYVGHKYICGGDRHNWGKALRLIVVISTTKQKFFYISIPNSIVFIKVETQLAWWNNFKVISNLLNSDSSLFFYLWSVHACSIIRFEFCNGCRALAFEEGAIGI